MKAPLSSAKGGTAAAFHRSKTGRAKTAPPPAIPMPEAPRATPKLTVEEGLERWIKLQGIGKRPNTLRYHQDIASLIRRDWPGSLSTPVDQVTDAECVEFARRISEWSTMRYNAAVSAIRKIVPAASVIPRRRYIAPEQHLPTPEQYNRLLAALDSTYNGHAGLVVRFLAHTGLRINEAQQIRWEHVRDDHIYAPATVTKNGKPRCIPFIAGMQEVLRALRAATPLKRLSEMRKGFVLPQARINAKTFLYACNLAGIPRLSHHTLRHFYATQCIMSGVDIPTVAKWLGHSDNGALLLRTYCHLMDDHSKAMAPKVKVGGLLPPQLANARNVIDLPFNALATSVPSTGLEAQAGESGSETLNAATC